MIKAITTPCLIAIKTIYGDHFYEGGILDNVLKTICDDNFYEVFHIRAMMVYAYDIYKMYRLLHNTICCIGSEQIKSNCISVPWEMWLNMLAREYESD